MDISVHTVEKHRKMIKRKLLISATVGLTRYVMEHGVLQGHGTHLINFAACDAAAQNFFRCTPSIN